MMFQSHNASMKADRRLFAAGRLAPWFILWSLIPPAWTQEPELFVDEEIQCTYRVPRECFDAARLVDVVTRAEIAASTAHSIAEILDMALGVDVRRRGPHGVQADVGMRGSSFNQVLILIDGVPMNDPQTEHHTLKIPIDLDQVERIEVVHGPGSRVLGPNALCGAINIVTQSGTGPRATMRGTTGAYGFVDASATRVQSTGRFEHHVSVGHTASDGTRHNTDFDTTSVHVKSVFNGQVWNTTIQCGHLDKAFGANGFYSPTFPDQYEETRTTFLTARRRRWITSIATGWAPPSTGKPADPNPTGPSVSWPRNGATRAETSPGSSKATISWIRITWMWAAFPCPVGGSAQDAPGDPMLRSLQSESRLNESR